MSFFYILCCRRNDKVVKFNGNYICDLLIRAEVAALLPTPVVKAKVFGKQFHTICSGGAYMNPAYIDTLKKYGITILQGYGMTECAPVISTNLPWNSKKGSVGKLLPNCEAKTVDEDGFVFLTGRKKNLIITPNGKMYRPRKLRISSPKSALLKRCLFVRAKVSSKQKSFLITNMLLRKKLRI